MKWFTGVFTQIRANAQEAGMFATWGIAAIALAAAAFMLRFLIALLREGAPSVCYWVLPHHQDPKKELPETLKNDCLDESRWATSELPAIATQGNFPAVGSLRKTGGNPIFVRLRIEPPWQS
jgi:hypothetical protein